jgi:two-component system, NtrC family, response regulator HydG
MKQHPSKAPVVLVDDDASVLFSSRMLLRSVGVKPVEALADSRELLPLLARGEVGVVVLDLFMPHLSGIELLPEIVRRHPEVPVIVMTAAQEVDTAVACMKEGAFDYLVKPVEESRFVSSVRRALEVRSLRRQVGALRRSLLAGELEHGEAFSSIVTVSRRMRALFQYVEAVAGSGEPVMLTGESGVGKELLARALHTLSGREGEFVQVNVAGLDDTLLSDTLFGHDEGAFTGAAGARKGLVARASGGTLLLDEIGDLEMASQVKLLRLLQERSYYPLGSDLARRADVRVVCATNRDLARAMTDGGFRADLYYRLTVHHADVPPLRARLEDIPALVRHFIDEAAASMDKAAPDPPTELLTLLSNHHFPGNVRELRAMVYDAVALHPSGPVLSMERFRDAIERQQRSRPAQPASTDDRELLRIAGRFPTLAETEAWLIEEALSRAGDNQGVAATLLGLSRPALNRRLARRRDQQEGDGGV